MVGLFLVRLMDCADLGNFGEVRRVTLRRGRFNGPICRGNVFRYRRIGPTAATLASYREARLVARHTGLIANLIRWFHQRQANACTHAVNFRGPVCLAGLIKDGARANADAYAGHVKEHCGQVEARVGIRRYPLHAFTRCELTNDRRVIRLVFTVRRLRLFRMFSAFRPYLLRFNGIVLVIRTFRSLLVANLNHYVLLIGIVRGITCARAIATSFVHMDQSSTFSNHSCLYVTFNYFMYDVRCTIDQRGRIYFLKGIRTFLRIVTKHFR